MSALLERTQAGFARTLQLNHRTPEPGSSPTRWSACSWRIRSSIGANSSGHCARCISTPSWSSRCTTVSCAFLAAVLVEQFIWRFSFPRVSWLASPILSDSPGKPPPLNLQLNPGHCRRGEQSTQRKLEEQHAAQRVIMLHPLWPGRSKKD